jgi:hypothetical protein
MPRPQARERGTSAQASRSRPSVGKSRPQRQPGPPQAPAAPRPGGVAAAETVRQSQNGRSVSHLTSVPKRRCLTPHISRDDDDFSGKVWNKTRSRSANLGPSCGFLKSRRFRGKTRLPCFQGAECGEKKKSTSLCPGPYRYGAATTRRRALPHRARTSTAHTGTGRGAYRPPQCCSTGASQGACP